jgi:hypothetical protein
VDFPYRAQAAKRPEVASLLLLQVLEQAKQVAGGSPQPAAFLSNSLNDLTTARADLMQLERGPN